MPDICQYLVSTKIAGLATPKNEKWTDNQWSRSSKVLGSSNQGQLCMWQTSSWNTFVGALCCSLSAYSRPCHLLFHSMFFIWQFDNDGHCRFPCLLCLHLVFPPPIIRDMLWHLHQTSISPANRLSQCLTNITNRVQTRLTTFSLSVSFFIIRGASISNLSIPTHIFNPQNRI